MEITYDFDFNEYHGDVVYIIRMYFKSGNLDDILATTSLDIAIDKIVSEADAFRLCDNVTIINDYGEEQPTEIALLKAVWKQDEGTYDYQWGVSSIINKRKTSCRKRIERLVKENEDYFK